MIGSGFRGGGGGWDGFGDYMREKTNKLVGQFSTLYPHKSNLFGGLTFWMSGRPEGTDVDIKQLVTENGGCYEQYGFRSVSHIIASNVALGNQQWRTLLNGGVVKKSYKVVTPHWVVDSVAARRKLPEADYLPECLRPKNSVVQAIVNLSSRPRTTAKASNWRVNDDVVASKKLIRLDIPLRVDGISVADFICQAISLEGVDVERHALVTIENTLLHISVHHISFVGRKSIHEVISNEVERQLLSNPDVSRASITFEIANSGTTSKALVFPAVEDGLNASADAQVVESIFNRLVVSGSGTSSEDIGNLVEECLTDSGCAVNAVIFDILQKLAEKRRLDVFRDVIIEIKKRIDWASTEWFENLLVRANEIFPANNGGANFRLEGL